MEQEEVRSVGGGGIEDRVARHGRQYEFAAELGGSMPIL